MLSRGATNTNFIVFGLTRSGLEPTRGEHANHYTTNAVKLNSKRFMSVKSKACSNKFYILGQCMYILYI
jgi:hypothetical protein